MRPLLRRERQQRPDEGSSRRRHRKPGPVRDEGPQPRHELALELQDLRPRDGAASRQGNQSVGKDRLLAAWELSGRTLKKLRKRADGVGKLLKAFEVDELAFKHESVAQIVTGHSTTTDGSNLS